MWTRSADIRAFILMGIISILIVLFAASRVHAETGIASHYGVGDGLHGSRTASGERFNAYGMTAAHRIRPFGSYVTVTNLANGRSVVVRVTDRGPFVRGRIIDLSYGAARAIGLGGTGRVSIR